jgi:hypothetical protein
LGLVLAVGAGVVLGAVLGQPGGGRAAVPSAKPISKTPPTISGTAEVGLTLTATRGTWKNSPTTFHFAWERCDATGAACLAIGGATARIYTLTTTDIGHTLRVAVTAHNSDGDTTAASAATGVVPPSGCPPTTTGISVSQLTPPARLDIAVVSVKPSVTRGTNTLKLHVTVSACGGRAVQGATVFAAAIPYNQFAPAQGTTAADGTVSLIETRQSGFPVSRHQHLLAVFVRAWKQGEPTTAGVSTSRVAAFHIAHH